MRRRVQCLVWDAGNEQHLLRHGIGADELVQLVGNRHIVVRDRKSDDPRKLLIGATDGGRIVTVVVEATDDKGTWRAVTAFPATKGQRAARERKST